MAEYDEKSIPNEPLTISPSLPNEFRMSWVRMYTFVTNASSAPADVQ